MSYIKFDKEQVINLEYSLSREILRTNKTGSYISTTLNGCNTRKYHGLLIAPVENFGGEKHVLLSSLDVSLMQQKEELSIAIHRYKGGIYDPAGHKYIRNIELDRIPKITYRIGGVILTMERILREKKDQILIRYSLEKAPGKIILRFKPFLAFRNIHGLSKANMFVNSRTQKVPNGISTKLYEGYPDLFLQFSRESEFIPVPDWYYDIEYLKELNRGYDYLEDLFVPGFFELPLEPGQSVIFSAGTQQTAPDSLGQQFSAELKNLPRPASFENSLQIAANQFIQQRNKETNIVAGFPWYGPITRQAFIALPGLAKALDKKSLYKEVLETYRGYLKEGLFPDHIGDKNPVYRMADAPLWFIWAVQHYTKSGADPEKTWKKYGPAMKEILEAYRSAAPEFIQITPEGLIHAEKENTALTWMDAYASGQPVTQRKGLAVEINALWYNAICFTLEMAKIAGDNTFVTGWEKMPAKVGKVFMETFWNKEHELLADAIFQGQADWSIRPNMVIAAGLDFSPLSKAQKKSILSVAKQKLLTKRGLRSLSPDHLRYQGAVKGGPDARESASHQGAAWPWLMQFFVEAYLEIHRAGGLPFVRQLMEVFEEETTHHCIGTLSEMYDGNPPHKAKGAISQAWSVAGVFYAIDLIQHCPKKK